MQGVCETVFVLVEVGTVWKMGLSVHAGRSVFDDCDGVTPVFVLFVLAGGITEDIDLAAPLDSTTQGIRVFGASSNALTGSSLHTADVNGDSVMDVIIGSHQATFSLNGQSRTDAGMVYILWGGKGLVSAD